MGISHNNFPGECQSEYVRHKQAAFIRKAIKLWKFSTSVFFLFCACAPLHRLPNLPPLSLQLYLLPYTSIFGHVFVACGTRWTNMQLVISRPPLVRPWSGSHIKRTTRPEHVPGPSCRCRCTSSDLFFRESQLSTRLARHTYGRIWRAHTRTLCSPRVVETLCPPIAPCKSHVGEWQLGKGIKMLAMSPKIKMK